MVTQEKGSGTPEIFSLRPADGTARKSRVLLRMRKPVEHLIRLDKLNEAYRGIVALHHDDGYFPDTALRHFNISYEVTPADMERIPDQGRVMVVANHCFGAVEGIIIASLLHSVRPDLRIMANYILHRIPEMRDLFIFVDPFGARGSARRNLAPLKESLNWLNQDGMLATFPAGEVAHYDMRRRAICEPPWSETIAGLIRRTKSPVLPVYFDGRNSLPFHMLGLIHPRLRTVMLPRELLNKQNRTFPIYIGNPIPFRKLEAFEDDRKMTSYLRMRTLNLGHRQRKPTKRTFLFGGLRRKAPAAEEPVIAAIDPQVLVDEIGKLPPEQEILKSGELQAWHARASQIPSTLKEIGRLRELTFRAAGEGTGHPVDLDKYDDYYVHVFLWNPSKRELAGAYRLGLTDEILPTRGKRGLYTTTLFRHRNRLLKQIDPALEMGRSFIRESYQRHPASLYTLWKGLAHYIYRYPRYRILFGPVSINGHYQSTSKNLLVSFVKANQYLPDLAKMTRARTPLRKTKLKHLKDPSFSSVVGDLNEVGTLISDIETELEGLPVLLRQYLRLGGKLLGFNVDPDFNYVLDGLILVDLAKADERAMHRYMGKAEFAEYREYHRRLDETRASKPRRVARRRRKAAAKSAPGESLS